MGFYYLGVDWDVFAKCEGTGVRASGDGTWHLIYSCISFSNPRVGGAVVVVGIVSQLRCIVGLSPQRHVFTLRIAKEY